jgi:hypothetical protein
MPAVASGRKGIGEPRFEMARELNLSKDTVHRIWRAAGVKPHHAAVFCVDEKSAIQALDRLDPVLPSRVESIVPYSSDRGGPSHATLTKVLSFPSFASADSALT